MSDRWQWPRPPVTALFFLILVAWLLATVPDWPIANLGDLVCSVPGGVQVCDIFNVSKGWL
jgi:hypothetical protein